MSAPLCHPEPMDELTDTEREMIAFERQWWKHAGAKEAAIREKFDLSTTVYFARLNLLLNRPEAMAYDPMTVKRLIRLRDARREKRRARSLQG